MQASSPALAFLAATPPHTGKALLPSGADVSKRSFLSRAELAGSSAGNSARIGLAAAAFGAAFLSSRKSASSQRSAVRKPIGDVAVQEREEPIGDVAVQEREEPPVEVAAAKQARPKSGSVKRLPKKFAAKTTADEEAGATAKESGEVLFAGGLTGGQSAFSSYDYNFDPLGITEKLPDLCPWLRESELKHGRVAMLAFVGLVAPPVIGALPGLPKQCAAAGIGGELMVVEAHQECIVGKLPIIDLSPMFIMLLAAGSIEIVTTALKVQLGWGLTVENAGDYPGRKELGDKLNQTPKDDFAMEVLKLQELKHARLAMIAFAGGITQGALTANGFPWVW